MDPTVYLENNPISSPVSYSEEKMLQKEPTSYQELFLQKILGGKEGILTAISLLRGDRLTNSAELTQFLKRIELPRVDFEMIGNDPLFSMLILTLANDPAADHLRDAAAESYISKHPEDKRFEKCYAYLKTPHILIAHLLISTNQWQCANLENNEFYDEQLAGLFHGTLAFDKGDRISADELKKIQVQEGENPRFPIAKNLEEKEGFFEVKKWCSTPSMSPQYIQDR